jgi:translation initiation factor IF-3
VKKEKIRINQFIRSRELRVIDHDGSNLGVITKDEAVKRAQEHGLDLIEISPNAKPPVAKIMDYGKFQYDLKKKAREAKAKSKTTETKVLQVKIGTGEHDLERKASRATSWLRDGHRIKIDLFLVGRAKYSNEDFKTERLERILKLIAEPYKVAEKPQRSPKGFTIVIERDAAKQKQPKQHENKESNIKKDQADEKRETRSS